MRAGENRAENLFGVPHGKNSGGIAKGLTADGIEKRPVTRRSWQASTVLNILKNEKYYGQPYFRKRNNGIVPYEREAAQHGRTAHVLH